MERIRTEILPGVWLTALRTDKFKTAWLSVNLLTQLRRSTAACTAVLPYVLRRGSTRLPDLETIAAELESLYGASITPSVRKLGEIQAVGFEAEFADDGAVGEDVFPPARGRCGRPPAAPEHARRPAAARYCRQRAREVARAHPRRDEQQARLRHRAPVRAHVLLRGLRRAPPRRGGGRRAHPLPQAHDALPRRAGNKPGGDLLLRLA